MLIFSQINHSCFLLQEKEKDVPTLSSTEYGHRLDMFADQPDRKHVRIARVKAEFFRRNGITSWFFLILEIYQNLLSVQSISSVRLLGIMNDCFVVQSIIYCLFTFKWYNCSTLRYTLLSIIYNYNCYSLNLI